MLGLNTCHVFASDLASFQPANQFLGLPGKHGSADRFNPTRIWDTRYPTHHDRASRALGPGIIFSNMFDQRVIEPEVLDHVAPEEARPNLADLVRINRLFGGHSVLRKSLR